MKLDVWICKTLKMATKENMSVTCTRQLVLEALETGRHHIPKKSVRWADVLEEVYEFEKPYKKGSNGELSARLGKPRRVLGKPSRVLVNCNTM